MAEIEKSLKRHVFSQLYEFLVPRGQAACCWEIFFCLIWTFVRLLVQVRSKKINLSVHKKIPKKRLKNGKNGPKWAYRM